MLEEKQPLEHLPASPASCSGLADDERGLFPSEPRETPSQVPVRVLSIPVPGVAPEPLCQPVPPAPPSSINTATTTLLSRA